MDAPNAVTSTNNPSAVCDHGRLLADTCGACRAEHETTVGYTAVLLRDGQVFTPVGPVRSTPELAREGVGEKAFIRNGFKVARVVIDQ